MIYELKSVNSNAQLHLFDGLRWSFLFFQEQMGYSNYTLAGKYYLFEENRRWTSINLKETILCKM